MLETRALNISRPFIVYNGNDVSGTAGGNPSVESYCALDYTSASRYRLKRDDHNQIFQFFGNLLGSQNKLVYCLDKFADGPYNDVPYESRPFETLFPGATERQKEMFGWIMANAFPTVSASETFTLAGVDSTASPVLDDNDAYAAVQVALWVLLGQIALDEVYFLDCTTGDPHPKSDRMRATVLALLDLAGQYVDADATLPEGLNSSMAYCCGGCTSLNCCNRSILPTSGNEPYLVFQGCPNEVRTICGRLLIGPFRIQSGFAGQPQIDLIPFCDCNGDYSWSYMDFCGNPIADPVIGQEFYIALRIPGNFACFTLTASFSGIITRVIALEAQSNVLNYQPIGTAFDDEPITLTAELCICAAYPECTSAGIENGQLGININNNNNNSNDNNNNNNNNNDPTGGMGGELRPCLCMPPYPPCPPEPPYPPYPPCPPEPPYPPYPPCPPEPPYPPYPPCPPEPPCPPYPPCPPEPPCPPYPPCPPEPPCKPEPPCRPKPPCKPKPCGITCRPKPICKPEPPKQQCKTKPLPCRCAPEPPKIRLI
ncbi:Beta antigen [uncultured Eubacterium sp.]|nr:Beta antigen [uncultured Eubacterium sp.]